MIESTTVKAVGRGVNAVAEARLAKVSAQLWDEGWMVLDSQWMKNRRLAVYIAPVCRRGQGMVGASLVGFVQVDLFCSDDDLSLKIGVQFYGLLEE